MTEGSRRAWRCLVGYIGFVLLFLLSVGAMLALFGHLRARMGGGSVTASASSRPEITVVLDAGHGGEDGGAVGHADGQEVHEKDINLAVTLMLRDLLEADGVHVVLTRETDVLLYDRNTNYEGRKKVLDLAARLAIGQKTENALFVSIHMNAFPQTQYHGLQVYYSPNDPRSAALAGNVQSRIQATLQPDNHRKTKRAGSEIHLLETLRCPAVLVECGFLSNPDECAALNTPEYQQKLAFLLFCSIREQISTWEQESTDGKTAS